MKEPQPFGYGSRPGDEPGLGDPSDPGGTTGAGDDYTRDGQGNPGVSKIDETNLKQIATDLGVKYHHRDGGASTASVYTAPKYDQTLVKKDGRVTVDEYFWVPLILVFAWIAVEMVFGVRELLRLRTIAPARRGGRRPGRGRTRPSAAALRPRSQPLRGSQRAPRPPLPTAR